MNGAAPFTGVALFFLRNTEVSNYSHKGLCVGGLTRGKTLQRRLSRFNNRKGCTQMSAAFIIL